MAESEAASFVGRLQDAKFDVRLADGTLDSDVTDYVSTQAANLDFAIGRRGIPVGRMTTIIGYEAGGKSSTLIHLLAETQRRDGIAVLIDAERRYSRDRAERMGIDHSRLVYSEGETLEGTFEMINGMVDDVQESNPGKLVTIGWDSLSGSPSEAELKGEYHPGGHARAVSAWMRRIHPKIAKHRLTLVMVNQLRQRIDMGGGFLSRRRPDTMIAERALRYWSSLLIHCSQAQQLGERDSPTGIVMRAYIDKNTVAPPFKTALVNLNFWDGFDVVQSKLEAAKTAKLIEVRGSWTYYGEDKFQAKTWPKFLAEHPDLEEKIAAAPESWRVTREQEKGDT